MSTPMISEMLPYDMRREFFKRVMRGSAVRYRREYTPQEESMAALYQAQMLAQSQYHGPLGGIFSYAPQQSLIQQIYSQFPL